MEFKVTGQFNETYVQECLGMWRFVSKKYFNAVKTYSMCCLVYLAVGLFNFFRGKSISLFISSFGLACFLLLVIQLLEIYRSKKNTRNNAFTRVEKYGNHPGCVRELIFTEDCINYCDPEILLEIKWGAIAKYEIYENYVFFFGENGKNPSLSMDKNNISDSIKMTLFSFIDLKISRGD